MLSIRIINRVSVLWRLQFIHYILHKSIPTFNLCFTWCMHNTIRNMYIYCVRTVFFILKKIINEFRARNVLATFQLHFYALCLDIRLYEKIIFLWTRESSYMFDSATPVNVINRYERYTYIISATNWFYIEYCSLVVARVPRQWTQKIQKIVV
jgi:hypothetical protein